MLINTLFTITFAVELLAELRTWLTCSIPPTSTKSADGDDLAALTTRTVAAQGPLFTGQRPNGRHPGRPAVGKDRHASLNTLRSPREATRRIKADPALKDVPIIVVTSYAGSGDEAKARAAGCDDFVPKPFSPRQLLARIRRLLP
jgi:hypothetical protein